MDLDSTYDVIVIGTGPAGTTVARLLAQHGLDVLMLESGRHPRYKPCAGGITMKAEGELGLKLDSVTEDVVTSVSMANDTGNASRTLLHVPFMRTVMRPVFDQYLVTKALGANARIAENERVHRVIENDECVAVETGARVHTARYAIIATGAKSPLARALGLGPVTRYAWSAVAEVYPSTASDLDAYRSCVHIDFTAQRNGYGWIFPKSDHLSPGIFTRTPQPGNLRRQLRRFLESLGLSRGWDTRVMRAHPIPLYSHSSRLSTRRVAVIGDAAGLADPLTGEGIHLAALSASFAAETIVDDGRCGSASLVDYSRRVREQLAPEIRRAGILATWIGRFPKWTARQFSRRDGVRDKYARLYRGEVDYAWICRYIRRKLLIPF